MRSLLGLIPVLAAAVPAQAAVQAPPPLDAIVDSLQPYVEGATRLRFKERPRYGWRTEAQIRKYIDRSVAERMGARRLGEVALAYHLLGLLPDIATFLLCVLFAMAGGLIPATLLASAPLAAPAARLMPVVVGLMMQGSNLGQVVGPVAIGGVVETLGWPSAAGLVAGAALLAMLTALGLRSSLRRTA